jgi:hypothetical protein
MFFQNVTLRLSTCVMLFLHRYSARVKCYAYILCVKNPLCIDLCALASLRLCVKVFEFAFSAAVSLISAVQLHKLHSGGCLPSIRCTCAISAPSAVLPADTKCQFSALLPHIRPPFQRMYCTNCESFAFNVELTGIATSPPSTTEYQLPSSKS